MQAVVDDFNASQNRIFVKKLAVSEMLRKVMLATAGGNPPDVAGLWSSNIPDFAEKGALTPLNKFIDRAGIKSTDYIPIYWDQCALHGFIWALPSTPIFRSGCTGTRNCSATRASTRIDRRKAWTNSMRFATDSRL